MNNIMDLNIINKISAGLENVQNSFLQSKFVDVINNGVDVGMRAILPDLIEDQLIDVKDTLFQGGIKEAFNQAISSSIDLGKSAIGIFTGEFENLTQIEQAVKKGGLIDSISSVIDKAIDFAKDKNIIDKDIAQTITSGKKAIIKNISNNIENSLNSQISSVEKLNKYCENWQDAYKNQDLESMEKSYKKIEKELGDIIPLENTLKKAREVENLHNLIINNGGNFDISNEKLELTKLL